MEADRTTRERPPRHIVAVSGVVLNAAGEVLLVATPRRGWEPPGGQVESGEEVPAALLREIAEETGCQVSIDRLTGVYSVAGTLSIVELTFLCSHPRGVPVAGMEILAAGWFTVEQAMQRVTHPVQHAKLGDALAARTVAAPPGVVYRAFRREDGAVVAGTPATGRFVLRSERRC